MFASHISAIALGSMLILTAPSVLAGGHEAPNLVGTWSGSIVGGARFGALNHDPAQSEPVFADRTKVWTLTIEQQDGTGLIGTWSSERKIEKLVGVIRQDNVTVLLADEDNIFDARLVGENELELCALEAAHATIAVCFRMERN